MQQEESSLPSDKEYDLCLINCKISHVLLRLCAYQKISKPPLRIQPSKNEAEIAQKGHGYTTNPR